MSSVKAKTDTTRTPQLHWLRAELRHLAGATIESVFVDTESFGAWHPVPVLRVKTLAGEILEVAIMQDPEGNGPGHLDQNPWMIQPSKDATHHQLKALCRLEGIDPGRKRRPGLLAAIEQENHRRRSAARLRALRVDRFLGR